MPPKWREVDPTEGKSLRFALELGFEGSLMAWREGDEDEGWGICKKTMGRQTLGAGVSDLDGKILG